MISEASRCRPRNIVTERQLDARADKLGSYHDAYLELDVTPDDIVWETVPDAANLPEVPPIAVSLADRAMALAGIMEYLNAASKAEGMARNRRKVSGAYGSRAPAVHRHTEDKAGKLITHFRRGIAVLAATDVLTANGYDEADVRVGEISMQAKINKTFGVGGSKADRRNEIVKKAKRTASNAQGGTRTAAV